MFNAAVLNKLGCIVCFELWQESSVLGFYEESQYEIDNIFLLKIMVFIQLIVSMFRK